MLANKAALQRSRRGRNTVPKHLVIVSKIRVYRHEVGVPGPKPEYVHPGNGLAVHVTSTQLSACFHPGEHGAHKTMTHDDEIGSPMCKDLFVTKVIHAQYQICPKTSNVGFRIPVNGADAQAESDVLVNQHVRGEQHREYHADRHQPSQYLAGATHGCAADVIAVVLCATWIFGVHDMHNQNGTV